MDITVFNQTYAFAFSIVGGMLVGLVFDLFRVFRKVRKPSNLSVFIQDILFFILLAFLLFFIICFANNNEVRSYEIFGIGLGGILYLLTVSRFIRRFILFVARWLAKLMRALLRILLFPVYLLCKIFKKPARFIVIRLGNTKKRIGSFFCRIFSKIWQAIKNLLKISKKI